MGPPNGGSDGIREAIRQLERRIDASETDRRDLWKQIGAVERSQARIEQEIKSHREDVIAFKVDVHNDFDKLNEKFDKWASRQWMIFGFAVVATLGIVGNLFVLVAQRGSP